MGGSVLAGGFNITLNCATVMNSQFGTELEPGQCFPVVYAGNYLLGSNLISNFLAVIGKTKCKESILFNQ